MRQGELQARQAEEAVSAKVEVLVQEATQAELSRRGKGLEELQEEQVVDVN